MGVRTHWCSLTIVAYAQEGFYNGNEKKILAGGEKEKSAPSKISFTFGGAWNTCNLKLNMEKKGHIVMARRLETSISETARLMGCSRSTVVSTYAKWINDGETNSRHHGFVRPHAIKEKGRRRLSCMGEKNRADSGSADSPIQCRAK
ncbi:uncharacterized protein TNCV_2171811 [Trichonephila clavipes]|nr:uncharacterized protein TNCV_2171811 [Trichonephila clavipes]